VGYADPTWEAEETFDNPQLIKEYFTRGNPLQQAHNEPARIASLHEAEIRELPNGGTFVKMDLLKQDPATFMSQLCRLCDISPKDVLFVWASPPCNTFSNAAYNVGRGTGHGYNYRNFDDPQRGPCCDDANCEYRKLAVLHDKFLPFIQKMVHYNRVRGHDFDFGIENPRACLRQRPYMDAKNWHQGEVKLVDIDMCAYGHLAQKPTDFWTNMATYTPMGNTGDGKCHQRCGRGYIAPSGFYRHVSAYAKEPHRQPKGATRVAIPQAWSSEVLGHSLKSAAPRRKVVIDLCCGFRSLLPVAQKMGLRYIGVDHLFREATAPA
jgi:hypothetical protein